MELDKLAKVADRVEKVIDRLTPEEKIGVISMLFSGTLACNYEIAEHEFLVAEQHKKIIKLAATLAEHSHDDPARMSTLLH